MIKTYCTTCDSTLYIIEDNEKFRPPSTKYWAYNADGSKRPFCDAACGLIEYQKNNNNENTISKLQHPPLTYNNSDAS